MCIRDRDELQAQIDAVYITIEDYNETLFEKRAIVRQLDNEVGPVKYIAQLLYGSSGTAAVDSAVQIVIMLLIFVFDPLAIILVIAANLSFKERRGGRITAMSMPSEVDIEETPEMETVDAPQEGSWASMNTGKTDLYFKLEDRLEGITDDVHIDMELPPDATMQGPMMQGEPVEIDEHVEEEWVEAKYGSESRMDPKKEVDLQWLIDKKKGGDNA